MYRSIPLEKKFQKNLKLSFDAQGIAESNSSFLSALQSKRIGF